MLLIVRIVSHLLAFICLLALFPWLLGVPGVDNDYARGWTIGLYAILFYLAFFAMTVVWIPAARLSKMSMSVRWIDHARLIALGLFALAQAVAWSLILR